MPCRFLLVFLPVLLAAAPFRASGLEAPETLIARLGSAIHAEREAAQKALEVTGPSALPALRTVLTSPDAEVRRRARTLIVQLERQAQLTRALTPTRVRLVCKDAPVVEAIAELSKLSGQALALRAPEKLAGRKITLDTGNATFWDGLAKLKTAASIHEVDRDPVTGEMLKSPLRRIGFLNEEALGRARLLDGPLLLEDGPETACSTARVGPFRLKIGPAENLTRGPFALSVEVTPEPRLAWQCATLLRITRAIDDQGQDLSPAMTYTNPHLAPFDDRDPIILASRATFPLNLGLRRLPVQLQRGPRPSGSLRELHGNLGGWLRLPLSPLVVIDKPLEVIGQTFTASDTTSVNLVRTTRDEIGRFHLTIEVRPAPLVLDGVPPGFRLIRFNTDPSGTWPMTEDNCPVQIFDPEGNKLALKEGRHAPADRSQPARYTLTFEPGKAGSSPARLVYLGRETVHVEVPFVLRNVPLGR